MKEKLMNLFEKHYFMAMIMIVVIVSLSLTAVSVTIYVRSGAIYIDLSRPGFENVRGETTVKEETEKPFESSGPLNQEVIDDFSRRLEKLQSEMSQMNAFSNDTISDKALRLE